MISQSVLTVRSFSSYSSLLSTVKQSIIGLETLPMNKSVNESSYNSNLVNEGVN